MFFSFIIYFFLSLCFFTSFNFFTLHFYLQYLYTIAYKFDIFQVRDSLSRTLNTDIHVALSKLDKAGMKLHKVDEQELPTSDRSGSSTSGVYSSAGSVGSDSPDSNSLRKRELVKPETVIPRPWTISASNERVNVSRLTVGIESKNL